MKRHLATLNVGTESDTRSSDNNKDDFTQPRSQGVAPSGVGNETAWKRGCFTCTRITRVSAVRISRQYQGVD